MKKLTDKQKKERNAFIKKACFKVLRIFAYVSGALFWVLIIIALSSGSCSTSKGKSAIVSHAIETQEQGPIFYPYDIVGGDTKYYLTLNYRNYNDVFQFFFTYYDILHFDSEYANYLSTSTDSNNVNIPIYSLENNEVVRGFYIDTTLSDNTPKRIKITDISFQRFYTNNVLDSVTCFLRYYSTTGANHSRYCEIYTCDVVGNDNFISLPYNPSDYVEFNDNGISYVRYYSLLNQVFKENRGFFTTYRNYDVTFYDEYYLSRIMAYYWSQYSFDFNGYTFGGISKYLSTSYLFNNVYNGVFIYVPSVESETVIYTLFKGLWEYHNTLYDTIDVTLVRAWNGFGYRNPQGYDIYYDINYTINGEASSALVYDLYNGNNSMLENYYVIKDMTMYNSISNSPKVTLAYNRISKLNVIDTTKQRVENTYKNSLNENPLLYQTDSFINNNSILFYVFKINYDYLLSNYNFNPIISYTSYSDFFFATFNYTGVYGTKPPSGGIDTTSLDVFNPIFTLMSKGLSGLMGMFGFQILPGLSIGALIMVPFMVTLILATIKLFKR